MKVAILHYPGSNCDQDALYSMRNDIGVEAEYVWHAATSLDGFDAVFIPGGFTYGDYLRCGAIAARANIMPAVKEFVNQGKPVIGVCNGFQTLCEAEILPGALLLNENEKFICKNVFLKARNTTSLFTKNVGKILSIPIAHGEGRYCCDEATLKSLQDQDLIAFQYCTENGDVVSEANPNGSTNNIAGITNKKGNVLGMMPHPERATQPILGGIDGLLILSALNCVNTATAV